MGHRHCGAYADMAIERDCKHVSSTFSLHKPTPCDNSKSSLGALTDEHRCKIQPFATSSKAPCQSPMTRSLLNDLSSDIGEDTINQALYDICQYIAIKLLLEQ